MPKKFLDGENIVAALQQMCSEQVPERVRGGLPGDRCPPDSLFNRPLQQGFLEMMPDGNRVREPSPKAAMGGRGSVRALRPTHSRRAVDQKQGYAPPTFTLSTADPNSTTPLKGTSDGASPSHAHAFGPLTGAGPCPFRSFAEQSCSLLENPALNSSGRPCRRNRGSDGFPARWNLIPST